MSMMRIKAYLYGVWHAVIHILLEEMGVYTLSLLEEWFLPLNGVQY